MLFVSANEIETNSVENTIDTLSRDCMRYTVGNIWLAQLQKPVYLWTVGYGCEDIANTT